MKLSSPLVTPAWLAAHLSDPAVRVFDTTVYLRPNPEGYGYLPESGESKWREGHIPGSGFLDIIKRFSDPDAKVGFMMPEPEVFARLAGEAGIGDDTAVILYSTGSVMWATRFWWMLRSMGFDNVAVLDGGWDRWCREGYPVSQAQTLPGPARFTPRPRPRLWANKADMVAAITDHSVCTINALAPETYAGDKNVYGRAGHIPGSHNVFYNTLIDERDGTFWPAQTLRARFEPVGAFDRPRVIAYCGGGISATMDALALTLAGHPDIAVYDGSMSEWVADEALPLVTGTAP